MYMHISDTGSRFTTKAVDVPELRRVRMYVENVVKAESNHPARAEGAVQLGVPLAISRAFYDVIRGERESAQVAILESAIPAAKVFDVGGERTHGERCVRHELTHMAGTVVVRRPVTRANARIAAVQRQPACRLVGHSEIDSSP